MTDETMLNNADSSHTYRGDVYCAASGRWAFRVTQNAEEFARGAGFEDEIEAAEACSDVVPFVDFPIFLSADPAFDLSAEPLTVDGLLGRINAASSLIESLDDSMSAIMSESDLRRFLREIYVSLNPEVAE